MEPSLKRSSAASWPDLPLDVLLLISENLSSTWDFIRFRSVCSSWRSAVCPGYRLPPQVPSLILPYDLPSPNRSFFDVSSSRVLTMDIPEASGKWIYGTPYGWLIMLGQQPVGSGGFPFTVSVLNPITRNQILLPDLPPNIRKLPEQDSGHPGSDFTYSTKPILTGSPSGSSEVVIALMIFSQLAVCRVGAEGVWTVIELGVSSAPRRIMCEFTYFDGSFYVVDVAKGVTVVSTDCGKKKYSRPSSTRMIPNHHTLHLVGAAGDLFLLEMSKTRDATYVEVEKLDRSGKKLKWVKVKDNMSGCSVFVSHIHSSISLCPPSLTMGGRGLVVMTTYDLMYDPGLFTTMSTPSVRISEIVSGISDGREQYYWTGSRRPHSGGKNFIGLSWIIPSPC